MIRHQTANGVARITLDTPETGNKFSYQLMLDFITALTSASNSGAAILLLDATGADFTLGRDQSEKLQNVSRRDSLKLILQANRELQAFPGVTIALIQGRAMGFGSGLALHADISVASQDAVLGFNEIKYGLAPLVVLTYLSEHVGPKIAKELIYTGRDVSADEALQLGLLNRVVPAADLQSEGERLIAELGQFHAGAIRLIHGFTAELPDIATEDRAVVGIDRLVEWIEAGKP